MAKRLHMYFKVTIMKRNKGEDVLIYMITVYPFKSSLFLTFLCFFLFKKLTFLCWSPFNHKFLFIQFHAIKWVLSVNWSIGSTISCMYCMTIHMAIHFHMHSMVTGIYINSFNIFLFVYFGNQRYNREPFWLLLGMLGFKSIERL